MLAGGPLCGSRVCKELVFFFARLSRFLLVNGAMLGLRGSCILWEGVFYAYSPLGCVGADVATVDSPAPTPLSISRLSVHDPVTSRRRRRVSVAVSQPAASLDTFVDRSD